MRFPQACNNNMIELIIMLTISLYGNRVLSWVSSAFSDCLHFLNLWAFQISVCHFLLSALLLSRRNMSHIQQTAFIYLLFRNPKAKINGNMKERFLWHALYLFHPALPRSNYTDNCWYHMNRCASVFFCCGFLFNTVHNTVTEHLNGWMWCKIAGMW